MRLAILTSFVLLPVLAHGQASTRLQPSRSQPRRQFMPSSPSLPLWRRR